MIYTRGGDSGTTTLIGGRRVRKDNLRIEACGTVDELNAHIGLLVEYATPIDGNIGQELKEQQGTLFVLQGVLATDDTVDVTEKVAMLGAQSQLLEQRIDDMTLSLPELNTFVRPGGSMASAQCHVVRTVCRRAERRIVALHLDTDCYKPLYAYVNRLSDYLFVLSRFFLHCEGLSDDCITPC